MSKRSPRVTVIIPTYNRAQLLCEAIRSVLRQDFADFELLIIDDGSTDDTRERVQNFGDMRLRYIYQANQGISAAMNQGLRQARGEYIARLDSDDVWLPQMLSLTVGCLDRQAEVGVAYGRAQGMDRDGKLLYDFRGQPEWFPSDSFRSMVYSDFTCNIAIVARRACFERGRIYDESLPVSEDWDLWLRIAQDYRFYFINEIVAHYRYHDEGITASNSKYLTNYLNGRIQVLDKLFQNTDLSPQILQMKPVAYFNAYCFSGLCWIGHHQYSQALACFDRALRWRGYSVAGCAKIAWGILAIRALSKRRWGRWLTDHMARLGRHV